MIIVNCAVIFVVSVCQHCVMERPRKRVRIEEHNLSEGVLERAAKRAKIKKELTEIKSEVKDEIQFIKEEPTETQTITVRGHTYYEFIDLNEELEPDNANGISEELNCTQPGKNNSYLLKWHLFN